MRTNLVVSPRVVIALAVAALAPFVLLLGYALLWTAYDALGVTPHFASWLSLASVLVLPAYAGRAGLKVAAYVLPPEAQAPRHVTMPAPRVPHEVREVARALRPVPPPTACETTLDLPPCPDVPAAGEAGQRLTGFGA